MHMQQPARSCVYHFGLIQRAMGKKQGDGENNDRSSSRLVETLKNQN